MERHETMVEILEEIKKLADAYTEGLIADFECLKSVERVIAYGVDKLVRCLHCGEVVVGDLTAVLAEGSKAYHPCCSECYAKYHARYLCVWGIGYHNPGAIDHKDLDRAGTQEHGAEFFTMSRGYDLETRTKILALQLGEAITLTELTAHHSIVRVK